MRVSIDEAAGILRDLIETVRRGEEVVILEGDLPIARLELATRSGFRFGILADVLKGPIPDFLEPMDEEELALCEGRGPEAS
jgi:antitoxin (DNA-binding transcriptional repressor) of toxin-antitoxin stability system